MLGCTTFMRTPAARASAIDPSASDAELLAGIGPIDALLVRVAREARVLPALTPSNAAAERARLVAEVARGEAPTPRWELSRRRVEPALFKALDEARALARDRMPKPLRELYLARLDELEVDLTMIECVGDPVRVRPLAARRFGTGMREVVLDDGPVRVAQVARGLLERLAPAEEPRTVGSEELAALLRLAAREAGIPPLEVKIDARLVAGAATGDRGVFLAQRRFGRTECKRLVVHEILGHAVASANATLHPIRILEVGTAGSFADQEGLALCLEEQAGALDAHRMRVLAARVIATDRLHSGASFGETARHLHRHHGFSADVAVLVAERAYRGGGVARDAGYLFGYLRVRAALARGEATIDALRAGRVGLGELSTIADLERQGLARAPAFAPALERITSLFSPDPAE